MAQLKCRERSSQCQDNAAKIGIVTGDVDEDSQQRRGSLGPQLLEASIHALHLRSRAVTSAAGTRQQVGQVSLDQPVCVTL